MAVQVSIPTTAKQDARLEALLAEINALRQASGLEPFADVNAMATDALKSRLLTWVRSMETREAERVEAAYLDATNAIQAQIRDLLGIT